MVDTFAAQRNGIKTGQGRRLHYSSVRRLIGAIGRDLPPDTTVRLTFEPGEAAQVDFGAGPELVDAATTSCAAPGPS